jgi:hypothetical protein
MSFDRVALHPSIVVDETSLCYTVRKGICRAVRNVTHWSRYRRLVYRKVHGVVDPTDALETFAGVVHTAYTLKATARVVDPTDTLETVATTPIAAKPLSPPEPVGGESLAIARIAIAIISVAIRIVSAPVRRVIVWPRIHIARVIRWRIVVRRIVERIVERVIRVVVRVVVVMPIGIPERE